MPSFILWTIQIALIPALSPLFIGVTRKIKARFQNRAGASIFQPYRDLWKLLHKDEVVSHDASWISDIAPYVLMGTTILIGASIPLFSIALGNDFTSDFLVIVYLVALGTFFLALSGMDTGGPFGGFGGSREMFLAALTEGGLILALVTTALVSKSTNLFSIAESIAAMPLAGLAPIALAFIAFAIALLSETARYPFDNPATHLELTMVHEAMIIEYSGKRLALMEWASANKYLIFLALASNLFFPWGIAAGLGFSAVVAGILVFLIKISVLCLAIAVLESVIAKFRIFRLPDLLFTSFAVSVIAIGLIL